MPIPTNKQQLLDEAQKKYEALGRQVASFTPEEMVRPGVIGTWSIKDILAHLLEWQTMLMGWYEAGLRGEKPAVPAEGYNWSQLPELNQAIYERCRDAALDDVRSQLDASHRHMQDVVASLSEEELFTPGRYAWIGINTLASYVDSCAGAHYRWARTGIRSGAKVWSGETPAAKLTKRAAAGTGTRVAPKVPKNATALLIIDVQRELFEKTTPIYEAEKMLANIQLLVDKARVAKVPVFYVQHSSDKELVEGTDGWKLHPVLKPLITDHFIHKHHGNAFEDTPLKAELDALHMRRVVVAGLVTHGCVQATCNGAHELGYDVVLVKDAHSNYNAKARDVIDEWNEKLSHGIVRLQTAAEVNFGVTGTK
ncbi:MAG TPA: isochorismatase family protein [Candidatus Cryosericum sp.]